MALDALKWASSGHSPARHRRVLCGIPGNAVAPQSARRADSPRPPRCGRPRGLSARARSCTAISTKPRSLRVLPGESVALRQLVAEAVNNGRAGSRTSTSWREEAHPGILSGPRPLQVRNGVASTITRPPTLRKSCATCVAIRNPRRHARAASSCRARRRVNLFLIDCFAVSADCR